MSKPSEYLCTERCIKQIENAHLPLYAMRLLHACHYHIDQTPGLSMQELVLKHDKVYTVRCHTLLEATGTPAANDFNMIKIGVNALSGCDIFNQLRLSENGKKLTFRFSKRYADSAIRAKGDKFALIDIDVISTLRTPEQILFYSSCIMVLRSEYPMFTLPWKPSDGVSWSEVKKSWMSAAQRIAKMLEVDLVIIPQLDVETDEIFRIQVKVVKKVSAWNPGKLFPRDGQGVIVLAQGRSKTLSRLELRARRNWRYSDRP